MDPITIMSVLVLAGFIGAGADLATGGLVRAEFGGVRGAAGYVGSAARRRWRESRRVARQARMQTPMGRAVQFVLDEVGGLGRGLVRGWRSGRRSARKAWQERRGDEPLPVVRAWRGASESARTWIDQRVNMDTPNDPNGAGQAPNEARTPHPNGDPGQPWRPPNAAPEREPEQPSGDPNEEAERGGRHAWWDPNGITGVPFLGGPERDPNGHPDDDPMPPRCPDCGMPLAIGHPTELSDHRLGRDRCPYAAPHPSGLPPEDRCGRCDEHPAETYAFGQRVCVPCADELSAASPDVCHRCGERLNTKGILCDTCHDAAVAEVDTGTDHYLFAMDPRGGSGSIDGRPIPRRIEGTLLRAEHGLREPGPDSDIVWTYGGPDDAGQAIAWARVRAREAQSRDRPGRPWTFRVYDWRPGADGRRPGQVEAETSEHDAPETETSEHDAPETPEPAPAAAPADTTQPRTEGTAMPDIPSAPAAIALCEAFRGRFEEPEALLTGLRDEIAAAADSMGDFAIGGEGDLAAGPQAALDALIHAKEALDGYLSALHLEYDASIEAAEAKQASAHRPMQEV